MTHNRLEEEKLGTQYLALCDMVSQAKRNISQLVDQFTNHALDFHEPQKQLMDQLLKARQMQEKKALCGQSLLCICFEVTRLTFYRENYHIVLQCGTVEVTVDIGYVADANEICGFEVDVNRVKWQARNQNHIVMNHFLDLNVDVKYAVIAKGAYLRCRGITILRLLLGNRFTMVIFLFEVPWNNNPEIAFRKSTHDGNIPIIRLLLTQNAAKSALTCQFWNDFIVLDFFLFMKFISCRLQKCNLCTFCWILLQK